MQSVQPQRTQSIIYLTVLFVLQAVILVFILVSQQTNLVMYSIFRVIMLIGAHCMKSLTWAAYYIIFAIIGALFVFDPVGLWLSGNAPNTTKMRNAFAVLTFISLCIAVGVGYCYKLALQREEDQDFAGDSNQVYGNNNGGANNFVYRAADNPRNSQPQQGRGYKQFSGEGYSLS